MEFTPRNTAEFAGLVLLQNEKYQIRCVVTLNRSNEFILRLTRREAGIDQVLHDQNSNPGRVYLRVEATGQNYHFSAANKFGEWFALGTPVDGRVLSTPVVGGFTGAYISMYASSNRNPSDNVAYFDWFEYLGR